MSAREGAAITPEQMADMMLTVDKLVRQGWSIEAIYAEHGSEMPAGMRTCYTYIQQMPMITSKTPEPFAISTHSVR